MRVGFGPKHGGGMTRVFAPLYLGPGLAGWAQHDLATLPVFALLCLTLAAAVRRPDLHRASGWAGLAIMALVQTMLAALAFGAGALMARMGGSLALPLWGPLLLSSAAVAYGAWRFSPHGEMDVFLDSAIAELTGRTGAPARNTVDIHPAPPPKVRDAVKAALDDAHALGPDVPARELDPIAARLERAVGVEGFDPLYDTVAGAEPPVAPRIELLLLRFISGDRIQRALVDRGEATLAPILLLDATTAKCRAEARDRIETLINAGLPARCFPTPGDLRALAQRYPDEGYDRLAATVETLSND